MHMVFIFQSSEDVHFYRVSSYDSAVLGVVILSICLPVCHMHAL